MSFGAAACREVVAHRVIEGAAGAGCPRPPGAPRGRRSAERDLAALRPRRARLGHRRLVRARTMTVPPEKGRGAFRRAPEHRGQIVRALLTAPDATIRARLPGCATPAARLPGWERGSEPEARS
ncbi:hypothetical protein Sdia_53850 [Streptomyces diastaticus subsp. diastaticus]|uniref:Transposase n=2 Tax=Streptomyces diastaticus TaxID=1956 RepID=A0ABQ1CWB0_STRDI|nr:hypothetical protein Sdia_53850 [Streptomyces diastaticus subsp. diastaticus]GGU04300.1 hypothetical protein GCM10015534_02540 [Streptomyces diastaticus subsp. diastaticus]